jgi:hypothetical protein
METLSQNCDSGDKLEDNKGSNFPMIRKGFPARYLIFTHLN